MKAGIVTEAGQSAPIYSDFPMPVPAAGQHLIRVLASSISHLTKGRASGAHYSAESGFPLVAGVDGVGLREDGQRVYFVLPAHPYGSMAEFCVADEAHLCCRTGWMTALPPPWRYPACHHGPR
jgi:NADPH:quinone reductase-like Zn-dependent oxidoreductase